VKVLIDDMRVPAEGVVIDIIARTYDGGSALLLALAETWTLPTVDLLLDHDLGESNDDTGYKLICMLENEVLGHGNMNFLPKSIRCVSDNPVGAARIRQVIEKLYKERT